jgi:hypothetical protein
LASRSWSRTTMAGALIDRPMRSKRNEGGNRTESSEFLSKREESRRRIGGFSWSGPLDCCTYFATKHPERGPRQETELNWTESTMGTTGQRCQETGWKWKTKKKSLSWPGPWPSRVNREDAEAGGKSKASIDGARRTRNGFLCGFLVRREDEDEEACGARKSVAWIGAVMPEPTFSSRSPSPRFGKQTKPKPAPFVHLKK